MREGPHLFNSPPYPQDLNTFSEYSECSINICLMNMHSLWDLKFSFTKKITKNNVSYKLTVENFSSCKHFEELSLKRSVNDLARNKNKNYY